MVTDWVKKWMIAGVGMAALTKEKVDELVQDLVGSGQIDGEQSKQLARSILKQAEEQRDELRKVIDQQVKRVLHSAGFVAAEEHRALEARVQALESRLAAGGETPTEHGDCAAAGPSDT